MKKNKFISLFLVVFLSVSGTVFAHEGHDHTESTTTPPVVSIGKGNMNVPANTGPLHGSVFADTISVYATSLDSDLDNYHFRVVKDGSSQGHTCISEGALFAPENQGYASTTLGKDACGFVFNQSVYVSPEGFTNMLIATLDAKLLSAFSGDGDYWLIMGGLDTAGNRTSINYLDDSKVKITIDSTYVPTPAPAPVSPAPFSNGPTGGSVVGNGPIVGSITSSSFASANVNYSDISSEVSKEIGNINGASTVNNDREDNVSSVNLVQDSSLVTLPNDSSFPDSVAVSLSKQAAVVIHSGFSFNYLWAAALIIFLGVSYYLYVKFYTRKDILA